MICHELPSNSKITPGASGVSFVIKARMENYFWAMRFHPNAIRKNTVAVKTIAAPEAMLR